MVRARAIEEDIDKVSASGGRRTRACGCAPPLTVACRVTLERPPPGVSPRELTAGTGTAFCPTLNLLQSVTLSASILRFKSSLIAP
jgi:hypothetical protein